MLKPCTQTSKARIRGFLRGKLISDHGLFSSYESANKERRTGNIPRAFFMDAQGFGPLNAGSCASFTGSRPPAPWASVLEFSLSLHDVRGLEKIGLVDQN